MNPNLIKKSFYVLKNEGLSSFLDKSKKKLLNRKSKNDSVLHGPYVNYYGMSFFNFGDLREMVRSEKYRGVYVMGSLCLGWFDRVKQRQHHIAEHMMEQGYLVICGMNPIHDADFTYSLKRINKNLVLADFYNRAFWRQVVEMVALEHKGFKFYHIIGTEPGTTIEEIKWLKSLGFTVNYEFYDEISKEIFDLLEDKTLARHDEILQDEEIVVVTTADKLYQEATKYRTKNVLLSVNAATVEDWIIQDGDNYIPEEMSHIIEKKQPIIGFYGSFAAWLDYDCIKKLSFNRPNYQIVMIGYDYENGKGAFAKSKIKELSNVHIIPAKPYNQLKYYSQFFDVAIVPFRIYTLTETVSPVKMFEHMAQRIPVVTTDMRECRKYPEILIATSHEDFIDKVDKALSLKDNTNYTNGLYECALENSWKARGAQVQAYLEEQQVQFQRFLDNNSKLLSVVVPSYNMEKFLHRCVDSVLHSGYQALLDVIIVNDGSKDKTLEMARAYEGLYPSIVRVIDKKNGGHGSCINAGVEAASGKYIKLVDSDDFLESTELLKHLVFLSTVDVDLVVTNYNRFYEDGHIESLSYSDRLQSQKIYQLDEFLKDLLKDESFVSYAHMHSITYLTDVLKNKIKITENSFYVDQEYITFPLKNVRTVAYQPIFLYHYFIGRPGQSVNPEVARKRSYMNLNILRHIKCFYDSLDKSEQVLKEYLLNVLFHQTSYWLLCTSDKQNVLLELDWWKNHNIAKYDQLKKQLGELR